ncbi:MAG: hypothetical protein N2Z21_05245 [Candidatus Sumerlaeaceae bacterium]|nr:hypothetical protein [Candidatus Sumerlaeaceae bacterium]
MRKILSPYSRLTILLGDVVKRLPPRLVWPMSRAVGRVLYWTLSRRRRDVKRAYEVLCQKAGLNANPNELARGFFERQLMLMVAAYSFRGAPPERFRELCEIQGLDAVKEEWVKGNGVLVLSFHFGTHLLSLVKLEQEGVRVTTVRPEFMKDIKDRKQKAILFIDRETIYVGEGEGLASPVRSIVRKLREGYVVGFAPDGDQGGTVMTIPLFSGEYPVRRGLVEIVKMARCPVVYAQGMVANGKYYIWYSPIMRPPIDGEMDDFITEVIEYISRQFERLIREFPESVWWTKPMEVALGLRKNDRLEPVNRGINA